MPTELRPRLVAEAMAEAGKGAVDLSGLWVATRHARTVGVLLTHALAGRAVAIWAPEVVPVWGRRTIAAALIRSALADVTEKGFRVAQALVDRNSPRSASVNLAHGGLPWVTRLVYMSRPTAPLLPVPPSVPRFTWQSYSPETDAEFRRVLNATYLGSLDMPELEGARSLDDVIVGHRAAGRFEPTRWRIGHLSDDPDASAIVLLTANADRGSWEVSYFGLSPRARGRGLGRAALAEALDFARLHAARLELAVDTRNTPALHLYRRAGFEAFDRREVHLKVLRKD